jgi:cation transport regulator ChaC
MRHHYFAYGSNMLVERLRAANRAPSARPVSHARLDGWRLRFDKRSTDGSGKCHLEPQPGACVHGVVYRLDENDFRTLDQAEGVGSGYERKRIRKVLLGDGSEVDAFAYLNSPGFSVQSLRTSFASCIECPGGSISKRSGVPFSFLSKQIMDFPKSGAVLSLSRHATQ